MAFRAHLVFGSFEKRTTCLKNCGPINLKITNLFSLNLNLLKNHPLTVNKGEFKFPLIQGQLDRTLNYWSPFLESPETFRAHFGLHNSLCIFRAKASRGTKLCIYFNFYSFYNIRKDRLSRTSGSQFYEWLFGPEKFSGLSRNGAQGPVSRTSRELFGPEKLVVKLESARFEKLIFLWLLI